MPLGLIKGEYRITHSEPDGDSVHFYPDDPDAFQKLNLAAHMNSGGGVQLRLDAIDALETHYTPRVRGSFLQHQPLGLAHAAGARLLELIGFTDVTRNGHEMVTDSTPDATPGYILTRFADKYGRPVSLAYAGGRDNDDLSPVRVDVKLLKKSANYQLVSAGLAYPTYYSKLYPDLRRALTTAVSHARAARSGIWADDLTTAGVKITSLGDLNDGAVIMPKLFRRLVDYFALNAGSLSLSGFLAFLAARDDRLLVLSEGHMTGFDSVVEVDDQTVRLNHPPEDLVFIEA
jgi:endonuclease YncB( thermonuclease family)